MKTLLITFILIPYFLFLPDHNQSANPLRIVGHITDSIYKEPVPFACVKFFINDSLRGFSVSDFDGKFVIADSEIITDKNDKLSLQIFYVNDIFKEVKLNNDSLKSIKITLYIKDKITGSQVREWREDFIKQNQLEHWFYCYE